MRDEVPQMAHIYAQVLEASEGLPVRERLPTLVLPW